MIRPSFPSTLSINIIEAEEDVGTILRIGPGGIMATTPRSAESDALPSARSPRPSTTAARLRANAPPTPTAGLRAAAAAVRATSGRTLSPTNSDGADPLTAMRRLPASRSGPARKPKAQRTLTAMDGSAGVKSLTDQMAQEWQKAQAQAAAMHAQEETEEMEAEPEPQPAAQAAEDSAPAAVRAPPLVRSRTMARRSLTAEEQAERDAASEEEWERRVGIRAPAPSPYETTVYASIDEPLAALPAAAASSRFPATTLPSLVIKRHASRALAPIVDPQLYCLDVERGHALTPPAHSSLRDPLLASSASASSLHVSTGKPPVIRMGELVEMGRRSAAAQPGPLVQQEEKLTWRMHTEQGEEKESNQTLSHAASTPNLSPSKGDAMSAAPEYRFVGTPSLAALQFLKSNVPVSEVLTPRARYDLLARSAQQIVPEPIASAEPARADSRPMTAVGAVPSVHGLAAEMHQLSVRARAGPLLRQRSEGPGDDISPLGSARSMVSSASAAAGVSASAGAPPLARQISWGQYRENGTGGASGSGGGGESMLSARSTAADDDSLPGSPSSGGGAAAARRARARAEILARVGSHAAGDRHIQSLKHRSKLPSQYLEETESSPLSTLATLENWRVSRGLRPKSSVSNVTVIPGSRGFKQEYSSAALLAAQEVHGIRVEPPPPPPAAKHKGKHARTPVHQQHVEQETTPAAVDAAALVHKRGSVDPELVAAAAASRGLLVTRPDAPSPAPLQGGHRYMKTHALHHHLPLDLADATSPGAAAAGAKRRSQGGDSSLLGVDTHLIEERGFDAEIALVSATRSAEPLPSSSPALHMTSPSSKPDWQPPSLACTALAEEIYATSRRGLTHIVSSGEGEEALERHLVAIRPARVTEGLRKQAMAAAAIQSMQAAAASKQARMQRAAAEANAQALSKKKAADAQLKRKQIEAARERKAALAAGLDSADIAASNTSGGSASGATPASNGSTTGADLSPAPSAADLSSPSSAALEHGEPSPSRQHWEKVKHSDLGIDHTGHAHTHPSLARSGSLSRLTAPSEPKVVNFSCHRMAASAKGGSAYGPAGEDLHERASRTVAPASFAAGHMLDSSVAAASESAHASSEAKRLAAINEYNAVLARLYKNVTPQEKRLKRLDMPRANREDVRRVVAETLGLHDPNARKRFQ